VKRSGQYAVSGLIEGQFEPGSQGRGLRNLIGIKSKREMDTVEGKELVRTFKRLISVYDDNHRFNTADLCSMHKEWLGSIYGWAGKYRQVNLAKGDFTFAAAHLIPGLMADFGHQCLAVYTPCRIAARNEISPALATRCTWNCCSSILFGMATGGWRVYWRHPWCFRWNCLPWISAC